MKFRSSRTSFWSYQIVWSVIPSGLKSPLSILVSQHTIVIIPVVQSCSSVVSISVSIMVDAITPAIAVTAVVIAILSNQMFFQRCFKRVVGSRLKYLVWDAIPDGRPKSLHGFITIVVVAPSSV